MKPAKPHTLLLALCLSLGTPLALAATDLNDQRAPGTQSHDDGHMDGQGDATGSGTPGDSMGTGDGGTDDNGRTTPEVTVPTVAREPAVMALVIAVQARAVEAAARPVADQDQVPAVN